MAPLVRVIVPKPGTKVIVSPTEALAMVSRNEPRPLSLAFVTMSVLVVLVEAAILEMWLVLDTTDADVEAGWLNG